MDKHGGEQQMADLILPGEGEVQLSHNFLLFVYKCARLQLL